MTKYPTIPYYKVVRLIQEGGTSTVYEGVDLRSRNIVAIKHLFQNRAQDSFMLKKFREEANHYLLLQHPNIPRLVDFVEDNGQMFLVMEFVKGIDLSKYLKMNGPLNDDMIIHFFSMILDTIGYLHQQHIMHLDIKPSNIMVTEELGIKILDLGISTMVSDCSVVQKRCGSPSFMAPEQINKGKLGYYTDIYQIGVTLYNMITGRLPFNGSTQHEIFDNVCNQLPLRLEDVIGNKNVLLQSVIDRSLQKNGKDRYLSCEEFKDALLHCFSDKIKKEKELKKNDIIIEDKSNMKIITVGREIGNDIVISNDIFVGRHHLQLIKDDAGVFFVRDLQSTNGTFVNGRRISGEVRIGEQDVIRIGNTTLPWISYFVGHGETEVESQHASKNRRQKKTPEEKREQMKKIFSNIGKWVLRTLLAVATSIIMMLLFRIVFRAL